ncbi:MAG TPA: aspartate/glutamate/uridylate kinase [Dongiaceae bacterium]|nr:aspartate/glutamate/uridylate kinase [Dongiaceae bacterium]
MPSKTRGTKPVVVVKLGGSLMASPHLSTWLATLSASRGAAVIVAGGGPFADAVRVAQETTPFDDRAAHRMAILAMEQYAIMLAALEPGLRLAAGRAEIKAAARAGATPIWLPARMSFDAPDIPESWEVTSDSLAVWLARKLGLAQVLLVKSAALPMERVPAAELAEVGIVDPVLPRFLAGTGIECRCLEAAGAPAFAAALAQGRLTGTLLSADEQA